MGDPSFFFGHELEHEGEAYTRLTVGQCGGGRPARGRELVHVLCEPVEVLECRLLAQEVDHAVVEVVAGAGRLGVGHGYLAFEARVEKVVEALGWLDACRIEHLRVVGKAAALAGEGHDLIADDKVIFKDIEREAVGKRHKSVLRRHEIAALNAEGDVKLGLLALHFETGGEVAG